MIKTTSVITHERMIYHHSVYTKPSNDYFDTHTHDMTEFIYLIEGDVSYIVEGERHKMECGYIYIVNPAVSHRIEVDGDTIYDRYNILLHDSLIPSKAKKLFVEDKPFLSLKASDEVYDIFKRMDNYYTRFANEELFNIYKVLSKELMYILVDDLEKSGEIQGYSPAVKNALVFIDENFITIKDVDEICKYLFLSKSRFHHIFTDEVGMGPMEYIRKKKLAFARDALLIGEKATDVYLSSGFSDYSAFFRSYKKEFGRSPSSEEAAIEKIRKNKLLS